jgi:hypothetical protein
VDSWSGGSHVIEISWRTMAIVGVRLLVTDEGSRRSCSGTRRIVGRVDVDDASMDSSRGRRTIKNR